MATKVMALFPYEDTFLGAVGKLKEAGFVDLALMTPIPVHGVEKVLGEHKSAVRRFSLAGAIIGAIAGFSLAVFSALTFILPTGGRAIIAFPPFLVITYELTILMGVLATLLGFHVVSGLPAWHDKPYDTRIHVDRFAILVGGENLEKAEQIIREAGAEEIKRVEED